jgi:hypothetical protein
MRLLIVSVLAFGVTFGLWSVTGVRILKEIATLGVVGAQETLVGPADGEAAEGDQNQAATDEEEGPDEASEESNDDVDKDDDESADGEKSAKPAPIKPGRVPKFVTKGVEWLVAAQHNDGGWGGGSHAQQDVRDPHAVTTDPATTSFTLLSLLRAGHTPVDGKYKPQVRKGLEYLVAAVEKAPTEGPLITDVAGTQPQSKLGRNVDTAMTAQYLARAHALLPKDDKLQSRVDKALDKCLAKLQVSQEKDGSWGQGSGWAPVLQSSLSCSALEIAAASGKQVDESVLDRARSYQKGNFDDKSGRASTTAAAGVELYAFGGAFRANASEAAQAEGLIKEAKDRGELVADAKVTEENLQIAGASKPEQARKLAAAATQNSAQIARLGDDKLLDGFGNNGGEEFLSYLITSETMLIAGGDKFHQWQDKMQGRLTKVQNADGSWSGHHCITSPVFCTAAVVQCLTADQDAEFLVAMAKRTTENTEKVASAATPAKVTIGE